MRKPNWVWIKVESPLNWPAKSEAEANFAGMAEFDLMFEQMFELNSKFDLQAEFEPKSCWSRILSPWPNAESELRFVLHSQSTNTPNHHPELALTGSPQHKLSEIGSTPAWLKNSTNCRQDLVVVKQHDVSSILPDCNNRKLTGWKTGWEYGVANSTSINSV